MVKVRQLNSILDSYTIPSSKPKQSTPKKHVFLSINFGAISTVLLPDEDEENQTAGRKRPRESDFTEGGAPPAKRKVPPWADIKP